MNSRSLLRFLLYSAFFSILCSCAKISAPTGGLRDKLPPVVVKSEPGNGSVNFRGKRLEITFNEYVVLDNITDKFMVSPPLKKKPKIYVKGKTGNEVI